MCVCVCVGYRDNCLSDRPLSVSKRDRGPSLRLEKKLMPKGLKLEESKYLWTSRKQRYRVGLQGESCTETFWWSVFHASIIDSNELFSCVRKIAKHLYHSVLQTTWNMSCFRMQIKIVAKLALKKVLIKIHQQITDITDCLKCTAGRVIVCNAYCCDLNI